MLYYGFVLPDGTELVMDENIRTHEELSINFIKNNSELSKEFRRSSLDSVDFMVLKVGAIKVGNFARSNSITVAIPHHSELISELVIEYSRIGYKVDRIFMKDYQ